MQRAFIVRSTSTTTSSECRSCIRCFVSMPSSQGVDPEGVLRVRTVPHCPVQKRIGKPAFGGTLPSLLYRCLSFPQCTSLGNPQCLCFCFTRGVEHALWVSPQKCSRHPRKAQRVFFSFSAFFPCQNYPFTSSSSTPMLHVSEG